MARIPQSFIDDLLARVDLVELIGERVELRKAGRSYKGLCPFHAERTPSFTVSPDKGLYHCFGCGAGGNAIGFLMEHDRLGFVEAVEQLARRLGIEVPREGESEESASSRRRRALYDLLGRAADYYREQLAAHPAAARARRYLQKRGIAPEVAARFGIGYAPPGWDNLVRALGGGAEARALLVEAGLAAHREREPERIYDRFRDRLIFPIRDPRGRTLGFGARLHEEQSGNRGPKYLNSPETPLFHKGRELYGLYEALRAEREPASLVVVEGYLDVVSLAQHGVANAVATLGTAVTRDHLEKLFRTTSELVFCFDGDAAGRAAARRALETCLPLLEDGRTVRFLLLPQGEDPDSLVRARGGEHFRALVREAPSLSEFLFAQLGAEEAHTPDQLARLCRTALPLLARIPGAVLRRLLRRALAERLGLAEEELEALAEPPPRVAAPAPAPPPAPVARRPPPGAERSPERSVRPSVRLTPARRAVLLLLANPALHREIPDPQRLRALDDPHAATLADLVQILARHPQFSLNQLLGHWRGLHGAQRARELEELVEAGLVAPRADRDDRAELRDVVARLSSRLEESRHPRERLEALLARGELDLAERKLVQVLYARLPPADREALREPVQAVLARGARRAPSTAPRGRPEQKGR
ncbi:MAG: hypothetical protein KatS3mg124_0314 [Porticoccaceae bacterium]|nr:MAG: hypothetical protein KatS3mg124_0314 [Porticoccaceae bacterium]